MPKLNKSVLERLIADIMEDEKDLAVERQQQGSVKKAFDRKAKYLFQMKQVCCALLDDIN